MPLGSRSGSGTVAGAALGTCNTGNLQSSSMTLLVTSSFFKDSCAVSNVSVLFDKGPVKRHHKVLCDNIQVFSTAQRLQALRVPGSPPPSLSPSRTLAFVITNGVCRIFEFVASVFGSFKDIGIALKAFPFVIYVFKTTVSL